MPNDAALFESRNVELMRSMLMPRELLISARQQEDPRGIAIGYDDVF